VRDRVFDPAAADSAALYSCHAKSNFLAR